MRNKFFTVATVLTLLFSLCFAVAYANEAENTEQFEEISQYSDNDIAAISDDVDITVDAFELMQQKEEQYNADMSAAYAGRNSSEENVNSLSGTLTLSQVDYSIPLTSGSFELKRIFNSDSSCDDYEYNSSGQIKSKTPFYNNTYHLGFGWRFSFPMLEIIPDGTHSSDGTANIASILYHSESGAVYSLRPIYQSSENNIDSIEGFKITNHNLNDMDINLIYDGDKKASISITHKNQGITYKFDSEGKITNINYSYADPADCGVSFEYDDENFLNKIIVTSNGSSKEIGFNYTKRVVSSISLPGGKSIEYKYYNSNTSSSLDKVLCSVIDIDGKPKNIYYVEKGSIKKGNAITSKDIITYFMKGVAYCRDNKLSCYTYEIASESVGTPNQCQRVTSQQNYKITRNSFAVEKNHTLVAYDEISQGIADFFTTEPIGDETTYMYPEKEGYIEQSASYGNTFVWESGEPTDNYFLSTLSNGYKRLVFSPSSPGEKNTVSIYTTAKSYAINVTSANSASWSVAGDENSGYVYTKECSPYKGVDGYCYYIINCPNDILKMITVSNVAKYISYNDKHVYNETFTEESSFWQPVTDITDTHGGFDFIPEKQYMHSWRRLHSEMISRRDYKDFVLDTTIQFMRYPIDDHTSAGVIFRVSDLNPGNNNFNGYYVRISPESDNENNRNSIGLYRMSADNSNRYKNLNEYEIKKVSFADAGLGTNCDESKSYALRVTVIDNIIKVYVVDMQNPVITYDCARDGAKYQTGKIGVRTFQRRAAYTSFRVAEADYTSVAKRTIIDEYGKETVVSDIYDYEYNLISSETVNGKYKTITAYTYDDNRMPKQIMTYDYIKEEDTQKYVMNSVKCENYTYDKYGNLIEYRSPLANRAEIISEESDDANVEMTQAGNESVRYSYDPVYGLPLSKTVRQNDGTVIRTNYLLNSNRSQIVQENVLSNGDPVKTTSYEYDKYGRLIKKSVSENKQEDITEYSYDLIGGSSNYSITETKTYCSDTDNNIFSETVITKECIIDGCNGSTLSQTDGNGNMATYTYDNAERLESISYFDAADLKDDANAQPKARTTYEYSETDYNKIGNVQSMAITYTDENGNQTEITYDAYGRVIKTAKGENLSVVSSNEYNMHGNLVSSKEPNGTVVYYEYDELDRPIKMSKKEKGEETAKLFETYSYSYESYTTTGDDNKKITVSLGNPIVTTHYYNDADECGSDSVTYDLKGREIKRTNGEGNSVITEYDYVDNKVSITDGNDNTTRFTYDALGRLTKSEKVNGDVTYYSYNVFSNLNVKTEGNNVYEYTYDTNGMILCELAHLDGENDGYYSVFTYDGNGNVTTSEKGTYSGSTKYKSEKSTCIYDYRNRPVSKIIDIDDLNSQDTYYEYDSVGNLVKETEKYSSDNAYITIREYDYAGNIVKEAVGKAAVAAERPEVNSELSWYENVKQNFAELLSETSYSYDNNGNLTDKESCVIAENGFVDGNTVSEHYEYDAKSRVKAYTSPVGLVTSYIYDSRDNVLSSSYTVSGVEKTTTYNYDLAGRLVSETDPEGNETQYAYDGAGNLVQTVKPYYGINDRTEYEYDSRNRLVKTIAVDNGSSTIIDELNYDASGNVIEKKNGDITLSYSYDAAGNIISSTDGEGNTASASYDGSGRVITQTDGNGGATTFTYYLNGLPKAITYADGVKISYALSDFDLTGKYKVTSIDRMGNKTVTENNCFGKPVKITYADGNTEEFAYDALGRMLTSTDRMGIVTNYTYDNNGNLTEKSLVNNGQEIEESYSYSPDNLLLSHTDPCGNTTHCSYDKAGNLTEKSNPNGTVETYAYVGDVIASQSANGIITDFTYDVRGNVIAQTTADRTTAYQYDPAGNVIVTINPDGGRAEYSYDKAGRVTNQTFGESETRFVYDGNGNVKTEIKNTSPVSQIAYEYDKMNNVVKMDDNGTVTAYEYDDLGRCVKVTLGGAVSETYYDLMGNVYASKNAKGQFTLYTYDKLGRLLSTADSVSDNAIANIKNAEQYKNGNDFTKAMRYTYDEMGNKLSETNALGNANIYVYDNCGRVLSITYPDENSESYTYDDCGNVLTMTDAKGNTTNYEYENNRLVKTYDSIGTIETCAYNEYGEVASKTDGEGNVISYAYDPCGRLASVTVNTDETTFYDYDAEGNKISMTDGEGHVATYSYYPFGLLASVTDAEGNEESYEYDARGNLTRKTDAEGREIVYTYDDRNNLTETHYDDKILLYEYDALNNRTKMTDESGTYVYAYDDGDRLTKVTKNGGSYLSYEYDKLGNVIKLNSTAYTYDACSRLKTVDGNITYTYDKNGNLASTKTPVGITEYTYDERNRVTDVVNKVGSTVQSSYSYTYFNNDLEKTKSDNTGKAVTYSYDRAGRILSAIGGERDAYYTYDKAGNRISLVETEKKTEDIGGVSTSYGVKETQYVYNGANMLTVQSELYKSDGETVVQKNIRYVYDKVGNEISHTAEFIKANGEDEAVDIGYDDSVVEVTINNYNALGRLTDTTNIKNGERTFASYVYDGDGIRAQKTVDGETTDYVVSGGYVYSEQTGKNTKTYIRGLSYHGVNDNGAKYYYFCNAHGDVTSVVNGSSETTYAKYEYDEFGNLTEQTQIGSFKNDIMYAGEFFDRESENYYLRARYYDPSNGRFTQADSFLGVENNPLSLNRYTYCHNNPIAFVDPSGFVPRSLTINGYTYNYDTDDFTSSDMDYEFSKIIGAAQRGEINSMEFLWRSHENGVSMSLSKAYVDTSMTSFLDISFENLSYEQSMSALGSIEGYIHGSLSRDYMEDSIRNTAQGVVMYEVYAEILEPEKIERTGLLVKGSQEERSMFLESIIKLTGDDRYYINEQGFLILDINKPKNINGGSEVARALLNAIIEQNVATQISYGDDKNNSVTSLNGTIVKIGIFDDPMDQEFSIIHELTHVFTARHEIDDMIYKRYSEEYYALSLPERSDIDSCITERYREATAITVENMVRNDLQQPLREKGSVEKYGIIAPGGYGEFPYSYTSKESGNIINGTLLVSDYVVAYSFKIYSSQIGQYIIDNFGEKR